MSRNEQSFQCFKELDEWLRITLARREKYNYNYQQMYKNLPHYLNFLHFNDMVFALLIGVYTDVDAAEPRADYVFAMPLEYTQNYIIHNGFQCRLKIFELPRFARCCNQKNCKLRRKVALS